jgi:hypothetical protein
MTPEQRVHVAERKLAMLNQDRKRINEAVDKADWELHRAKNELKEKESKNG